MTARADERRLRQLEATLRLLKPPSRYLARVDEEVETDAGVARARASAADIVANTWVVVEAERGADGQVADWHRVRTITDCIVAALRERGWVEPEPAAPGSQLKDHLRLSRRGRAALRQKSVANAMGYAELPRQAQSPAHRAKGRSAPHRDQLAGPTAESATSTANPVGTLGFACDGAVAWLRSRRDAAGNPMISDAEYAAAQRLKHDFIRADVHVRTTVNLTPKIASSSHYESQNAHADAIDRALAARQRLTAALESMEPRMAQALVAVCCHERSLAAVERDLGWPARSAKLVLALALGQLARHYGLALRH
ncbi:MAG: DUF6456 domain-containing protein [Hyphomicrobiaceae bacterium]